MVAALTKERGCTMGHALAHDICWKTELLPLAQRHATEPAVYDLAGMVTFAELFAKAAGIARAVLATSAPPCSAVATLLPNGRDAVAASYGVTLAGAAETRLNPTLAEADLAHCVATARIPAVVTDASRLAMVERLGVRGIDVATVAPGDLASLELPSVPAGGFGRIGFSSGTTGKPKGIVHAQAGRWTANVLLRATLPRAPGPGDNVLLMTPFSHGAALLTYAFLDGGAAVTLLPGVDPAEALSLIAAGKVNHVFAPPTVLAKLLSGVRDQRYPGLAAIFTGTAPLSAELYRRARYVFGPVVRVTYGKSEIWNPITVLGPGEAEAWYGDEGEPRTTCVGWPASGVEIAIDRAAAGSAGEHEGGEDRVGEVCLRTRHMSIGLLVEGEFRPDAPGSYHRTGDLGFIDDRGRLHLCGRLADVMKSGGYRILPEEVEADLREAAAPAEIAVLGLPSSYWGEVVTLVVAGGDAAVMARLEAAMQSLTQYKRPRLVAHLDEIPRNSIGKVVRRLARTQILERYAFEDGRYPKLSARP